jgi:hypothetical protein
MENGVKQVLPNVISRKTPPGNKNKGKMIGKACLVVSPLLLYKINKNSALLKGK